MVIPTTTPREYIVPCTRELLNFKSSEECIYT